jgi:hypothetical protein
MTSVSLLFIYLITDETKVLLYNFFEDSTATLNQWRLVLNAVSRSGSQKLRPLMKHVTRAFV